jgi:hypothetical protein
MSNMNIKITDKYLTIFLVFFLVGCGDNTDNTQDVLFSFYPRKCKFISSEYARLVGSEYDGNTYYDKEEIINDTCCSDSLLLIVSTSNLDSLPDECNWYVRSMPYRFHEDFDINIQDLDGHNTALEQQMKEDYLKPASSSSGRKSTSSYYTNLVNLEYRTTGVTAFSITCNKTLFGKVPGTSLNGYFYIYGLDPHQIVSYETKELIFGCNDDLDQMGLAEWLDMKPMAQPTMYLRLNSTPPEVPDTVNFTIHVTTTAGLKLELVTQDIVLVE